MFADIMVVIVESCLRASVVLSAAWALTAMMRHASAATRHFVWSCAIAGAILAPALNSLGARWPVSVPATIAGAPSIVAQQPPLEVAEPVMERGTSPHAPSGVTGSTPSRSPAAAFRAGFDATFVMGLIWAAGGIVVLAYVGAGMVGAWLLRQSATRVPPSWVEEARTLAEAFEIGGVIDVVESAAIAMPMASGVWRPLILLPPSAADWSDERRRVVVLHELAHIKRRDCLTQAVAQVVCAMYWFNPIVWFAARRLRIERERACDDFVLAAGEKRADYAAHLLDIAQTVRRDRTLAFAGLAMARPSQLEGRLLAILNPAVRRSSALHTRLASLGFVLLVTLPVGAVEFRDTSSIADTSTPVAMAESSDTTGRASREPATRLATNAPAATTDAASPATPRPTPSPFPRLSLAVGYDATRDADASRIGHAVGGTLGAQIGQAVSESLGGQIGQQAAAGIAGQTTAAADPKTIESLIGALSDSDPDVRETVVLTLGRMRDPRIVTALLPLLKDTNADVRQQVVFALARSGDPRAAAAIATLIDDASTEVREQVVHLLGRSRNRDAVPALVNALKDSSSDVREQAAFALGQLRDVSVVDPLLETLKDPTPDVRQQAAFALGQIRNGKAVDGLIAALKDSNADVREQAAFALSQLRDPKALPSLTAALKDSVADVRQQAAFAIGQISGQ
jgi:HEAT repeat protein/beta-lactamase regulating signal transducer with metallopeptidase domain